MKVYDACSAITIPVNTAMNSAIGMESTPILPICGSSSRPHTSRARMAPKVRMAANPARPIDAAVSRVKRPTEAKGSVTRLVMVDGR